ncbi:MAG: hypothetical protein M3Q75_06765, partial [Gemmatimonadota bacterium]|nr:hypothetical protein [Gemmatimonadota bacterium]
SGTVTGALEVSGTLTGPTITGKPRGHLAYLERTTTLAASTAQLTDADLVRTITIPSNLGSRRIEVQLEIELLSAVAGASYIGIWRNGVQSRTISSLTVGGANTIPLSCSKQFTEVANAVVTYQVRVGPSATGSSQGIYATADRPAIMRIIDSGDA